MVNIVTNIGVRRPVVNKEVVTIIRGASATLNFDLFPKIYSFEDIEQVSFIFKQGKKLTKFDCFVYDNAPDRNDVSWDFDKHFSWEKGEGYSYLTFVLTEEETKDLFTASRKAGPVLFEVVVKLDTDQFETLKNIDSTIIEPQEPLGVVDSLYSEV